MQLVTLMLELQVVIILRNFWRLCNTLLITFNQAQPAETILSSKVSAPPWNIDLAPFYLGPSKKILNLSYQPPSHPSLWPTLLKMLEKLTPLPLKCTLIQKRKDSFFYRNKIFYFQYYIRTPLNVKIWIYSCKI